MLFYRPLVREIIHFLYSLDWSWILGNNLPVVFLSLASLVTSIAIFRITRKDNRAQSEAGKRLQMVTSVVLQYHIPQLYRIFENLNDTLGKLKLAGADRKEVEQNIQLTMAELNDAIYVFAAVNPSMYHDLLSLSDRCRDNLVESIGNDQLDFVNPVIYRQNVARHALSARNDMIQAILNQVV